MRTSLASYGLFLIYGLLSLLTGIAYTVAIRYGEQARWKFLFGGMAGVHVLWCLNWSAVWLTTEGYLSGKAIAVLSTFSMYTYVPLWGWTLVISMLDVIQARRRDWLHWTGVATYLASGSVTLVWLLRGR